MKKIPNLFERDWNGDKSRVLPVMNKTADVGWVLRGEGRPTVKWDDSAMMYNNGEFFVRYDAKLNRDGTPKAIPEGFIPCQERDLITGHLPGWISSRNNPAAKWHVEAGNNFLATLGNMLCRDGATLEAVGPHFQGNPYKLERDICIIHGIDTLGLRASWPDAETAHAHLTNYFSCTRYAPRRPDMHFVVAMEGIVFHHPDGRMCKVLSSDLGVDWKNLP